MDKKIITNSVQCTHCKDIVVSEYRHDWKTCKCGKVSVDGGHDYIKRVFVEEGDFVELSKFE